jgi:hypothetical protein
MPAPQIIPSRTVLFYYTLPKSRVLVHVDHSNRPS